MTHPTPTPPSPQPSPPQPQATTNSSPRLDDAVMDVMDSRVSKGTKGSYCRSNSQFIAWIFFGTNQSLKQRILAPWFFTQLTEVEMATRLRNAGIGDEEKRRKRIATAVTKTARKAVEAVNCQDANCPIVLQNLTFQIFSSYLVSKHQARKNNGAQRGGAGEGEEEEQEPTQYMSNSV